MGVRFAGQPVMHAPGQSGSRCHWLVPTWKAVTRAMFAGGPSFRYWSRNGIMTLARNHLPVSEPQSNGPIEEAGPLACPWCQGPSARWALGLALVALNAATAP